MSTHTWNDMRRMAVDANQGKLTADQILDWIAAYTDGRVAAERERIAQAIEAEAATMTIVGAHGMEIAAEIVRKGGPDTRVTRLDGDGDV